MQVSLVMFKADGTRRDFPFDRDRIVVGRKNNCDLRIPLSSVSRQHCEFRVNGDSLTVRDLGSSNGTYHNSIRVQEAELSPGDEVVIGPVVFTVVIDGEPAEIKPVHSMSDDDDAVGGKTQVEQPAHLPINEAHDAMPDVEPEYSSPTVDVDDPIAALERLAEAEKGTAAGSSGDDDDGFDFEFSLDDDEDDEEEEKR
jgi:pSer/pThr/pTyr-binding forkhead associated (FHA) protein